MEKLQARRAEMTDMVNPGTGRVRIEFKIPTRGLFGIRTEFLTETRGTGLLYHTFLEYGPYRGEIAGRNRGALVCEGRRRHDGVRDRAAAGAHHPLRRARTQGLWRPDRRRELARRRHGRAGLPQEASDQHARLELRHGRAAHAAAQILTLEQCLEWIDDDELVEVTPESIRIRKRILDHSHARGGAEKSRERVVSLAK